MPTTDPLCRFQWRQDPVRESELSAQAPCSARTSRTRRFARISTLSDIGPTRLEGGPVDVPGPSSLMDEAGERTDPMYGVVTVQRCFHLGNAV
jgi:hypothetical protein